MFFAFDCQTVSLSEVLSRILLFKENPVLVAPFPYPPPAHTSRCYLSGARSVWVVIFKDCCLGIAPWGQFINEAASPPDVPPVEKPSGMGS